MDTKLTRRTKWQALAHRKYPRMIYLGGDGSDSGCYLVLSKCPHQQTRYWRYVLCPDFTSAEATLKRWEVDRCNPRCIGFTEHTLWALRP